MWVLDTPANRARIERLSSSVRGWSTRTGISQFEVSERATATEILRVALELVGVHHCDWNEQKEWGGVEIYGAQPSKDPGPDAFILAFRKYRELMLDTLRGSIQKASWINASHTQR